jgi:hypothetical protein
LLVIQIDGIHIDEDLILVVAIGVDAEGDKHPLGLVEGATENAATVRALIDNLIECGLDPAVPRLFIIDGAKAPSAGAGRAARGSGQGTGRSKKRDRRKRAIMRLPPCTKMRANTWSGLPSVPAWRKVWSTLS